MLRTSVSNILHHANSPWEHNMNVPLDKTNERRLLKYTLMRTAFLRDGDILPCPGLSWSQCFTAVLDKWLCLWYNVKGSRTTKVVRMELNRTEETL